MINYNFNDELNILEVYYEGKISLDEMMDYGKMVNQNKQFPRELKTITDVTKAKYEIGTKDLSVIIESLKETLIEYKYIKAAFIQSKPRETALSILLENDADINNYYHRVFGTREAALDWLLM